MIKGGKYAYENVGGNYYKYTSIKVSGHEARLLRDKGQRVYKNRLIVNSSIAYKPTLHRKFKDPLTGIKDLAIVYRETGSGPVTRIGGTNFRVKLIGQGFTLMNFIAAVEQGKLPTDNRINYSIDVGDNMPFKRVFNNPLELLFYLGVEMDYPENFDPNTPPGANVRFPNMQQIERIIPRINISVFSDTRMKPLKSAQR